MEFRGFNQLHQLGLLMFEFRTKSHDNDQSFRRSLYISSDSVKPSWVPALGVYVATSPIKQALVQRVSSKTAPSWVIAKNKP